MAAWSATRLATILPFTEVSRDKTPQPAQPSTPASDPACPSPVPNI